MIHDSLTLRVDELSVRSQGDGSGVKISMKFREAADYEVAETLIKAQGWQMEASQSQKGKSLVAVAQGPYMDVLARVENMRGIGKPVASL